MDRSGAHSRHGSESRRAPAGDDSESVLGNILDVSAFDINAERC